MQCVLCYAGDAEGAREFARDTWKISCPRCGLYYPSGRAYSMLAPGDFEPEKRLRLTWAARQASDLGSPLKLTAENLDEIAEGIVEPRPPIRKLDELILLVGKRTAAYGESVRLDQNKDWPLVFARGAAEFANLIVTLGRESGHAKLEDAGLTLTTTGWERFAQLEAQRPASTAAFVAMWFDPEMLAAYELGFQPALYDLGYDPIRVDREHFLGKIDDFIIASIRKSALLVADFTGMRSGVFFEAGFGLGLGIPVIWTCREDSLGKLAQHFDTRQYNHLSWTAPVDLAEKLRTRIEAGVLGRPRPRK